MFEKVSLKIVRSDDQNCSLPVSTRLQFAPVRYNKRKYVYDLFEGKECLLAEAPRLGWVNFFLPKAAGLGPAHRQRSVHEVYCVLGGVLRMMLDGRLVEARVGEVLVIKPGTLHSGLGQLDTIEPCELCWTEVLV